MPPTEVPAGLGGLGGWLDDRFGGAKGARALMRKVFPDHWTFMLGEIALWSFVILLLTGTYLALFFQPSTAPVVYHGSYTKLDGITMSQAYQSTLNISFDIRGGLLIRQIHHWAADLFMIAICAHMLRHFFLGSYRKPRDLNWLIGIVIFAARWSRACSATRCPTTSCPARACGSSRECSRASRSSAPTRPTSCSAAPSRAGHRAPDVHPARPADPRADPGAGDGPRLPHLPPEAHRDARLGNSERSVGQPFWPYFLLKGTSWFFFIFGALALLATFAQINPVWLYGPYTPLAISSACQPDWYLGILEGALRMMPAWEINFLGIRCPCRC